jgi:hypothetical protein
MDHHGPVPYSISSQTHDPPHFSLRTTFKYSFFLSKYSFFLFKYVGLGWFGLEI